MWGKWAEAALASFSYLFRIRYNSTLRSGHPGFSERVQGSEKPTIT